MVGVEDKGVELNRHSGRLNKKEEEEKGRGSRDRTEETQQIYIWSSFQKKG